MKKRVEFNDCQNTVYETYSREEYDRLPIDSVLYLYGYTRVSENEWNNIFIELNHYKCTEMIVHKKSVQNTKLHEE